MIFKKKYRYKKMSSEEIILKAQEYNNRHIFERFKKEIKEKFEIEDEAMAHNLKREALRYLTMCALYPGKEINMFSEQVDEYWHTFILFSRDYFDFCQELGMPYIHHYPNVSEEEPKEGATFKDFEELYEETFKEKLPGIWREGKGSRCGGNGGHCRSCKGACKGSCKANVSKCMNGCGGRCGGCRANV